MPLVTLLVDTEVGKVGETVKVNGQAAQELIREGRAVVVREQRHERAARTER